MESIFADTCYTQVVYYDRADLWLCSFVPWAAFRLAGSVGAWCVSSPQPSHFTLSASWRAEMSGNNPSHIFPPQPSGCNTTCSGIYSDFILDRQQRNRGIHLNEKANMFNCSEGAQTKWASEAWNTNIRLNVASTQVTPFNLHHFLRKCQTHMCP